MKRVWLVARREFLAAVANKGFVIGLLVMPAIIALLVTVMPRLMNTQGDADPRRGRGHRPDRPGPARARARRSTPEAIARRRAESARRALENAPGAVRAVRGQTRRRRDRADDGRAHRR